MKNGKIDTKTLRTRKAKRDTYKARSEILVKKAEEIVNITGCEAFVDIVPTWQRGKHWSYRSPGYSNENIPTQNSSAIEGNSLQASTPHFTPQKRQPKSRKEETDLNCAKECNLWVHARCVGVFYANSNRGRSTFAGIEFWSSAIFWTTEKLTKCETKYF